MSESSGQVIKIHHEEKLTLLKLGKLLGEGSYGQVFLSKSDEGEQLAVKVMFKNKL
jgi:serine/threonine protein kinase